MKKAKKAKDMSFKFTVSQSPKEVFEAVNNVRGWWNGEIEGETGRLGAKFKYTYRKMHKTTQKITKLTPNKKVVWHVLESYLSFAKNKEEWTGTDIVFEIKKNGDKTELLFTHVGLVPDCDCYDACHEGWGFLIKKSLKNLITTGVGKPDFH